MKNLGFSILQKIQLSENGSIPLPKVQIGSNSLPKVQYKHIRLDTIVKDRLPLGKMKPQQQ